MPRKQLSANPVPEWLLNADASTPFNPAHVLQGSVYYPGCDVDGDPLQAYGGFAHSFVYVDYFCSKETILKAILSVDGLAKESQNTSFTRPRATVHAVDLWRGHRHLRRHLQLQQAVPHSHCALPRRDRLWQKLDAV